MGPNHGSNVAQNRRVRGIAKKAGLNHDQFRLLQKEIHKAKRSGAYDLDINGNLDPVDIEGIARDILQGQTP